MTSSLQTYLDFITETVYLAGRATLGYFQADVHADMKPDNSPVTIADRISERLIRERIATKYPNHSIVGEEFGITETQGASHRWFIDPIDGTKSFVQGVPLYAVLLGLEIEGQVKAGAAYFPALEEMLAAASGLGCWWNGRPARVSTVSDLGQAVVTFTDCGNFAKRGRQKAWERLQRAVRIRAGWGDAYGYCLVATGRADIMLDPAMEVWDCGPFPPILQESGGYFGDWKGVQTINAGEALATNQLLLPEVLSLLRG